MTATMEAPRNISAMLEAQWEDGKFLSVGIDPVVQNPKASPDEQYRDVAQQSFNIIDATGDIAGAFKPNSAFFEKLDGGLDILKSVADAIRGRYPNVPVIYDGKRGDIDNTNKHYSDAAKRIGANAVTLHPYTGGVSLGPFLSDPNRMGIILCKTSNEEAEELQELITVRPDVVDDTPMPLWERVARNVGHDPRWRHGSPLGIVVGATNEPDHIRRARELAGEDVMILVPGVGTQGGDLEAAVLNARNARHMGFLINVSSGISQFKDGATKRPATVQKMRAQAINFDNQIRVIQGGEPINV